MTGLDHIQLAIPEGGEAACRAFWSDLVGLAEIEKPEALRARGGCWFALDGAELHLGVEDALHPGEKGTPRIPGHRDRGAGPGAGSRRPAGYLGCQHPRPQTVLHRRPFRQPAGVPPMTATPTYAGFIATSLDGFIADADGGVGWLDPFNAALQAAGQDGGYADFLAGVDALLMGRATYAQVIGWGWPYGQTPAYVLTRRADFGGDHVAAAGDARALAAAIERAGHRKVWVLGGGETQRAMLDAGLFDTLRVFIMPTVLGAGRPLFAPGPQRGMKTTACQQLAGGILQIDYSFED